MSLFEVIRASMADISRIESAAGGVRVTTHCMYPSNSFVRVFVSGGVHACFVSDEGRALREIESEGIEIASPDGKVQHLLTPQGLMIEKGIVYAPEAPVAHAAVSIALVANASRDVANWFYEHTKIARTRDFKRLLRESLKLAFDKRVRHDERIIGSSNKPHKFENVIILNGEHRLIIDPVTNDPASINARVVANLDVRQAKHPGLEQRIVYDDDTDWTPADLNLLQVGAHAVPFSRAPEVLRRLAGSGG